MPNSLMVSVTSAACADGVHQIGTIIDHAARGGLFEFQTGEFNIIRVAKAVDDDMGTRRQQGCVRCRDRFRWLNQ